MADSPPHRGRRVVVLFSIAIALFCIFLTFYGPSTHQQPQLKMSTIKNVAVIGVC